MSSAQDFHFAPSLNHRFVMDNTEQLYRFDPGDPENWQHKLREKVRELLGLNMMPADRCDLNVRSLWRRENELGTIEKIVFTAEPYADVPAYLCLPHQAAPPYPLLICLQGHSTGMHKSIAVSFEDESIAIDVAGDRDFAIGCLKNGVAALCLEQRSFGERRETVQKHISQHGCHDATMHALMLGRTLAGERVYDVDRALDYLHTRNDIDCARIGVMGNSGGGTISLFSAAMLPRLQVAMPSCYFCTFRDSVMSIYHCADNYVPGLLRYAEMADVMGLFAPKPVVLVAGKDDEIFPLAGVKEAFQHLQNIYRAFDAEDQCHLVIGNEGHRFYADDAWPLMLKALRQ